MPTKRIISRKSESVLTEVIKDTPITLIHGPRQCGKTTLAKKVGIPLGYSYYTFDDDDTLDYALSDPRGFIDHLPNHAILDEVQFVPKLYRTIKRSVDENRIPGRFILTGSTNLQLVSGFSDAFVGRIETVRLHPLSQQEIEQNDTSNFLGDLFTGTIKTGRHERLKDNLAERIVTGGYPEALSRTTSRRRSAWYEAYLEQMVQKDINQLANIHSSEALPSLLVAVANLSSQLFNVSAIASKLKMNRNTILNYLILLERQFLIERIPAWYSNQLKRLIKTPKIHIVDTGLGCNLLGTESKSLQKNRPLFGQLVESFVFQELKRQASYSSEPYRFYHYRNQDGVEVDLVVEIGAFELAGIEIKSAASVSNSDFKALRKIKAAHRERFRCGVVLYDGEFCRKFGDDMYCVPIRMLWENK